MITNPVDVRFRSTVGAAVVVCAVALSMRHKQARAEGSACVCHVQRKLQMLDLAGNSANNKDATSESSDV